MSQQTIAILIGVAIVALLLLGALRIMRPREVTLADLPELPAPPKDDASGGPRMNA